MNIARVSYHVAKGRKQKLLWHHRELLGHSQEYLQPLKTGQIGEGVGLECCKVVEMKVPAMTWERSVQSGKKGKSCCLCGDGGTT